MSYTAGALCFKAALTRQVSVWQVAFWSNVSMSVLYFPFWAGADLDAVRSRWLYPAIVAILFFVGQLLTYMALRFGDVFFFNDMV